MGCEAVTCYLRQAITVELLFFVRHRVPTVRPPARPDDMPKPRVHADLPDPGAFLGTDTDRCHTKRRRCFPFAQSTHAKLSARDVGIEHVRSGAARSGGAIESVRLAISHEPS